jgi:hypothetical protein
MIATKMVIEKAMRQREKRDYSKGRCRTRCPRSSIPSTETALGISRPYYSEEENTPAISNMKGYSSACQTRHLHRPQRRTAQVVGAR